jgi:hypothetical protein
MIDSTTSWEATFRALLQGLPEGTSEDDLSANFLRGLKYSGNSRLLFEAGIKPLLADGSHFEIVLGFVDEAIGAELGIPNDPRWVPEMGTLLAARLKRLGDGKEFLVKIPSA